MHRFPLKDKERLNKWTAFARRHRPKFVPQQFLNALCRFRIYSKRRGR